MLVAINIKKYFLGAFFVLIFVEDSNGAIYFDPSTINSKDRLNIDLSIFEHGGQLPGVYKVKIFINDVFWNEKEVEFLNVKDNLVPAFNKKDFESMGVSIDKLKLLQELSNSDVIKDFHKYIPESKIIYNFNNQRVDIKIPQAYILYSPDDYVPPELWEQGINAAYSSYDLNYSNDNGKAKESNDIYLNLNNGINFAGWRFRNDSVFNKSSDGKSYIRGLSTYIQHDLPSIKSQFVIGETYSSGELFNSFAYSGIRVFSDENMLPYSQQSLSPVIKGIAQSQSLITIKQNGYVIKQINVPAGAYSISDINAVNNGNLEITVRESNGVERSYLQPWTSILGMQREGYLRYSIDMGKYKASKSSSVESDFFQTHGQYGFNELITGYLGTQLAEDYYSFLLGGAQNLAQFGAVSLDITYAWADLSRQNVDIHKQGSSYRLQYTKLYDETNTNFSIAGYRFSSKGYYDFSEFNEYNPKYINSNDNKKNRVQFLIYQPLNKYGSLLLNIYRQDYWSSKSPEDTYSLGYSFNVFKTNFNINYMNSKYNNGKDNKQFAFSMSIPFSAFDRSHWASYGLLVNKKISNNLALNGNVDNDYRWSYSVRKNNTDKGGNNSYSLGTSYRGSGGTVGSSFSKDHYNNQFSVSASGSVLMHQWGATAANQINGAAVLVRAPDAINTAIVGQNVSTNQWGYAVLTNVSSYHRNRVGLDSSTLPGNVDADTSMKVIIPSDGAIGIADFITRKGYQALIKINKKGRQLSFGTPVSLAGDIQSTGIVDDKGFVYMSGLPQTGKLAAKWGERKDESCQISFSFSNASENEIQRLNLICQ